MSVRRFVCSALIILTAGTALDKSGYKTGRLRSAASRPSGVARVMLTPFPAMDPRISVANGVESQWLNSTELVCWKFGTTFFRVEINTGPDGGIGEPREWFSDPRFVDTPGQSYTISPAGGVVYLQGPEQQTAAYLRVIPNWVEQMKRAVDEANQ